MSDNIFWSIEFTSLSDGIEKMSDDIVYLIREYYIELPENLYDFAKNAVNQFELDVCFTYEFINCNKSRWKDLLSDEPFYDLDLDGCTFEGYLN